MKPDAPTSVQAMGIWLCRMLVMLLGLTSATSAAFSQDATLYDIPPQPLATALEVYSVLTGRQVIYNGALALNRQSAPVRGAFTPETALQALLDGTGLSPRYMADDAFVLVPVAQAVRRSASVNHAPPAVISRYYARVQASLIQVFCANPRTQPRDYRLAVSFWIAASGAVWRVELLGSTGDRNLDATIDRMIRSLVIAPPPQGFAQPVTLAVNPQMGRGRDCQLIGARP